MTKVSKIKVYASLEGGRQVLGRENHVQRLFNLALNFKYNAKKYISMRVRVCMGWAGGGCKKNEYKNKLGKEKSLAKSKN